MRLFNTDESYNLTLNNEYILLIGEFKNVMDWDQTKEKNKAFEVFKYVFLKHDYRSPYIDDTEEDKEEAIREETTLSEKELNSPLLKACEEKYKELIQSNPVISTLLAMKESIPRFQQYFKTVDFSKVIESGPQAGKLVHSVKDYLTTMKQSQEIFESLKTLESTLKEEMASQEEHIRGSGEKGMFE